MADDLTKKSPQDPKTVNTNQDWELNYWSNKWNVTKKEIKDAVKEVGSNSVSKVKKHLDTK